ncbi:MAG: MarR family winged helix-turn-helix transcriptional regulator [Clostridia bacterium]|nr:MarR family winged helix-turn-helix transcriptional regulator [Clostridia bacterium]
MDREFNDKLSQAIDEMMMKMFSGVLVPIQRSTRNSNVGREFMSLRPVQHKILSTLSMKGESCISETAKAASTSYKNMAVVVDDLVQRGLVARNVDENNRRFVKLRLTEAGEKFVNEFEDCASIYAEKLFDEALCHEEQEELYRCICKVTELACKMEQVAEKNDSSFSD